MVRSGTSTQQNGGSLSIISGKGTAAAGGNIVIGSSDSTSSVTGAIQYKEEFSSLVSNPTWTTNAKRHTSILPTFDHNPHNYVTPSKQERLLEKVQAFHQDVTLLI